MNRILWNEAERETIDEFVVHNASIHLEQMGDNHYWMSVTLPDGSDFHVNLTTKRAEIRCTEQSCDLEWEEDATHEPYKPGGETRRPAAAPASFPEPPAGMTWGDMADLQARANCAACAGLTAHHTHETAVPSSETDVPDA